MWNEVKSRLSWNKMRNLLIGTVFTVFLFSCNSSESTGSSEETLADQIVGDFLGVLQNPVFYDADYYIIVSEINDTRVRIAPASGSNSATFVVDLESQVSGSITSIILKSPDDILANNGTFVPSTGRLSYVFHLGGADDSNVEAFVGDKQ